MPSILRPCHDQAIVIPRPDLHAQLLGLWDPEDGGVINSKVFGPVRFDCPITYRIPAKLNTFALVQVDSLGTVASRGQGLDKPAAEVGDIVGIDLCQVGHCVSHDHNSKYFVPWIKFICKFKVGDERPKPLMNYVMTEYDETAMNQLMFKEGGNGIIVPDTTLVDGLATNSKKKTGVKVAVEKVVDIGQGRFVNKMWAEPGCKIGDAVMFMPTNASLDFNPKRGRRYRFTPWSECEAVLEAGYGG